MTVAEVTTPWQWASTMARFTPRVSPKSSASTIKRRTRQSSSRESAQLRVMAQYRKPIEVFRINKNGSLEVAPPHPLPLPIKQQGQGLVLPYSYPPERGKRLRGPKRVKNETIASAAGEGAALSDLASENIFQGRRSKSGRRAQLLTKALKQPRGQNRGRASGIFDRSFSRILSAGYRSLSTKKQVGSGTATHTALLRKTAGHIFSLRLSSHYC